MLSKMSTATYRIVLNAASSSSYENSLMDPNLGPVVLPSQLSPATLDLSLPTRSLGLHYVDDMLDALIAEQKP